MADDRRPMSMSWRTATIATMIIIGIGVGWWLVSPPTKGPSIRILGVDVIPSELPGGTRLHVTTRYENSGCSQILLARFVMNTRPTPTFVLPQQVGPAVLPATGGEVVEDVDLDFSLATGQWHLFTNVVCYSGDDPVPAAVVSPTALFDQS